MRLALSDLDDTPVDLTGAFARRAVEFAAEHDLPADAVDWLVAAHREATGPKDRLFAAVRGHFDRPTRWTGCGPATGRGFPG